jgi:hypothetical protein
MRELARLRVFGAERKVGDRIIQIRNMREYGCYQKTCTPKKFAPIL